MAVQGTRPRPPDRQRGQGFHQSSKERPILVVRGPPAVRATETPWGSPARRRRRDGKPTPRVVEWILPCARAHGGSLSRWREDHDSEGWGRGCSPASGGESVASGGLASEEGQGAPERVGDGEGAAQEPRMGSRGRGAFSLRDRHRFARFLKARDALPSWARTSGVFRRPRRVPSAGRDC